MSFTQPATPGIWRPTPPGNGAFQVPWLGGVTPLMAQSGAQFDPGPPPSMTSATYTEDFAEVKATGVRTGSTRTAEQTATARYFSGDPVRQFNSALRDQVARRGLDLAESARLMAAVNMSIADGFIGVWYAKLTYASWRPITAIQLANTDGNDATAPDPTWQPYVLSTPAGQTRRPTRTGSAGTQARWARSAGRSRERWTCSRWTSG